MIYLTGVTSDVAEPALLAAGVGLMVQPGNSYHRRIDRYAAWAADNGCFADRWEEDSWLAWLDALPRDRCLFAVAPDVYGDAAGSLERGARYFDVVRELGFPVALVAQDGAETLALPWDDFDALFIGGKRTTSPRDEWKVGAAAESLVRRARALGKWVHMGRVNSVKRLDRARQMGCLSADGTFVKYRRRRRASEEAVPVGRGGVELEGWVDALAARPLLPFGAETPALPVHRDALR